MTDEIKFTKEAFGEDVRLHLRDNANLTGRIAIDIVTRFALIAARDLGESSDGRQKLGREVPAEIVEFAVDVSERLVSALRVRGHLFEIPQELWESIGVKK